MPVNIIDQADWNSFAITLLGIALIMHINRGRRNR